MISPFKAFKNIFQPRPKGYLKCLDGIRTVSVICIILFHWAETFQFFSTFEEMVPVRKWVSFRIFRSFDIFVDPFFVVSGYLVFSRFYKELTISQNKIQNKSKSKSKNTKNQNKSQDEKQKKNFFSILTSNYNLNFMIRRLFRLYPVLLAMLVWRLVQCYLNKRWEFGVFTTVASLFFFNEFLPLMHKVPFAESWSISVEIKSYILALVIRKFYLKSKSIIRVFLLVILANIVGLVILAYRYDDYYKYVTLTSPIPEIYTGKMVVDAQENVIAHQFSQEESDYTTHHMFLYHGFHVRFSEFIIGWTFAWLQYKTNFLQRVKNSKLLVALYYALTFSLVAFYVWLRNSNLIAYGLENVGNLSPIVDFFLHLIICQRILWAFALGLTIFMIVNQIGFIGNLLNTLFSWRVFTPISTLSYSIFFSHLRFLDKFTVLLKIKHHQLGFITELMFFKYLLFLILLIFLVATLVYIFIEAPFCSLSPKRSSFDSSDKAERKKK
ncbi:o-acyltransferase [Anaeramoeba flamelloides]|uniref:O-acyltransferase n=1 Tax=Anaeramoeba flamelloides TaxID=1746091 RepID=A0AAV7ZUL2_9EUKA|nr:o-acyltransferase [Anaeramoeba flamelloides]